MGYIPQNARLTPRPETMASWGAIPGSERPFQRRLMEVFAGFTEHVDTQQITRVVDAFGSALLGKLVVFA
jgi:arylsulfatase